MPRHGHKKDIGLQDIDLVLDGCVGLRVEI